MFNPLQFLNFHLQFLLPYVNVLGIVGLRPITVDSSLCSIWFGHLQTLLIITLLLIGYLIQCFTGFRYTHGDVAIHKSNKTITLQTRSWSDRTKCFLNIGRKLFDSKPNGIGIRRNDIRFCGAEFATFHWLPVGSLRSSCR